MKTLILLVLFSGSAFAGDNCYVLDRGTPDWFSCKEQAIDNDKINVEHQANMRELQNENAAAMNSTVQTEEQILLLERALAKDAQNQNTGDLKTP